MNNIFRSAFIRYSRLPNWTMYPAIAGMAGIIAMMALNLNSEYQNDTRQAEVEVKNITRVLEQHVLATFRMADLLLLEGQRNILPGDLQPAHGINISRSQALHALLKSQVESVPALAVIHVADARGNYIYSSLDPIPANNIADREYFQQQQHNASAGLVVSPPLISRSTGKWTIILSRRLNSGDGRFAGIILAILDLDYFQRFYPTLDLGAHGLVALYDKDLRLAARYPPSNKDMGKIASLNAKHYIDQGLTHTVYHARAALDGIQRLIAYRKLEDLPLFVFAGIAEEDYLYEWRQHIWQYSLAAMVLILVVMGFLMLQRQAEVALHKSAIKNKSAEEEIKYLAFYDTLTRLPNRRLLMDRLDQALASSIHSGRAGALLFIDLDNFKTLNDTLGHEYGDQLLQQAGQRLASCVRETDTVGRLGGDEFVVVLEALHHDTAEATAQAKHIGEKILTASNQPYQLDQYEHHCTSSIGITMFQGDRQVTDELMKQADIAMYQAKKAGRDTLRFFNPQMQTNITARASLENELRKALENRQFLLHYQVQVDSAHRPLGAEALICWIHPEQGLVSPAQFIPLAEETGLILPIGLWVLETACAQIKTWQQNALALDLVMAVNVSASQFRQADFVAQVKSAVQRHAINPTLLKLELTESLLLENVRETIATMNELNEIGVQFSLDDFGTGYSSLQYLKQLPLDQLKIDQSFVRDIVVDSSDKAIVRTIIAIAQSMNLDVIAEGVETEAQRQLLLKSGCDHFQGYLFGKPEPIEQFEATLRHDWPN